MKNNMRNLIITISLVAGIFGITQAQVSGEFSTDVTFGENTSFNSPYTGLILDGEDWELSMNLSDDNVVVEEAKYNWAVTDAITLTFGSQAEPYGLAWGSHRPSANAWASAPREHSISDGVGFSTSAFGVGVNAFYGNDAYWAARLSYNVSLFGIDSEVGLSVNSNDAQLIDISESGALLGIPYEASIEYDLANDGAYWLRSSMTPEFAKGASILVGYNSDDEVSYGVGYRCSDNVKLSTELSGDGDTAVRISYSF
jgi:hypothetical protein|tara:strand:+ start:576 stop:1343 length:768 start_codon:yes stop_codon:yes gene_type:complete